METLHKIQKRVKGVLTRNNTNPFNPTIINVHLRGSNKHWKPSDNHLKLLNEPGTPFRWTAWRGVVPGERFSYIFGFQPAAFHLHNREAKRELKVCNIGKTLPFCPVPTYLGVKLDKSLTYRPHLEALRKKLSARVSLLRRLAGTGWGASAKTLRTAALSLVYSTAEYCAPVWCRSVHIRLIDSVINDALRIVTGCLRPTPSIYLPVLSGIQPAELRRQGATLSLANRSSLDPDHILHGQFHESQDVCRERLKSRRSFVPAARKLLDSLSEMDVRAAECTNTKWDMEYSANALSLHAFIPKANSRTLGMGLPKAAWVKLNRLRSGVGRFCSSMYKWGLAPLANCECGASEQTADHIISQCPIHRAPRGMFGLMVLDDETRCWLKSLTVSI